MSRDGFINDNLLEMRDNFRRHYSENQEKKPEAESAPEPVVSRPVAPHVNPPNIPVPESGKSPEIPAPKPRSSTLSHATLDGKNSDALVEYERSLRFLDGSLRHDLSAAETELENLRDREQRVENFREELTEMLNEMQNLSPEVSAQARKKLYELHTRYQIKKGQFDAIVSNNSTSGQIGGGVNLRWTAFLPLALAILLSGVIIAVTLIWLLA